MLSELGLTIGAALSSMAPASPNSVFFNGVLMQNEESLVRVEEPEPLRSIDGFSLVAHSSAPQKVIDCVDGYVYYYSEIYLADYTNDSYLVVDRVLTEVTPGCVAAANNPSAGYDSSRHVSSGYVHFDVEKFVYGNNEIGGDVHYLCSWPASSNFSTTYTSSWGSTLSGSSQWLTGVSLGNGMNLTAQNSYSTGLSFSFNYSLSTVSSDPVLSKQQAPSSSTETQWSYVTQNKQSAGAVTYSLESFYVFEIRKNAVNAAAYRHYVHLSIRSIWAYPFLWWWNDGTPYDYSVTIS